MVNLGIDPIAYCEYTPSELMLMAESYQLKEVEKVKEIISLAWHTEAFARHKKLPKLDKVLKNIGKNKKQESKSDIILKNMAKEKGIIL